MPVNSEMDSVKVLEGFSGVLGTYVTKGSSRQASFLELVISITKMEA